MVPTAFLRSCLMFAYISVTWIPSARLQCTSRSGLRAVCHGLGSIKIYLANDSAPVTSPTITCRDPGSNGEPHTDWSLSPGGGSQSASILDTSPAKYTVSGNRLTISNVDGTDEGLYRCVYENGGTVENACIYVYGKAVFASCPLSSLSSCASSPTSLSVSNGGDAGFDATVIHTPGGSCGFKQEIRRVKLTKINPEFGVDHEQLLSCNVSSITCANGRVYLSRGNDPGYEFVFTLTGATVGDSGMYKVEVDVIHPRTISHDSIIKMFYLNVSEPVAPAAETTVDTTVTPTSTDHSSSEETPSTNASVSSKEDSLIIPIVIAVIVAVVIVIVVLVSIIAIGGYLKGKRKRIPSAETCSEKVQSPEKTVEYSGPPVEERIGDTILQTHLNGTVSRAVQNQPDTNTKTVVELPPPEAVAELPPPNTRISWIEPDSAAFGHWDGVDVQAFNV